MKLGDKIYIPTSLYIDRGEDDVQGGLATISRIEHSRHLPEGHINRTFIYVKEVPGHGYNLSVLLERQDELKKKFGNRAAYPDPDFG